MHGDVERAAVGDIPGWLELAREVEPLFGPMADDPEFVRAVERHVAAGSAWCVRDAGGVLIGGMLCSVRRAPECRIAWLAVAERVRCRGLGAALVRKALDLVTPPAQVAVTTFGEDVVGGEAARRLYERMGFVAAEIAVNGPEGGSRRVYRIRV